MAGEKHCVKRDLEVLAGKLQQASRVIHPGRCFLHHFYAAMAVARQKSALMRVNKAIRADVWWWHTFMQDWNEVSLMWSFGKQEIDEEIWSDASGAWGCRAHWGPRWLSVPWAIPLRVALQKYAIEDLVAVRELVLIVLAASLWGGAWRGRFHSDNMAVVGAVNKLYSSREMLMHLLRCLTFAAKYSFWFCAMHVPGVLNVHANALSRDRMQIFFSHSPQEVDG